MVRLPKAAPVLLLLLAITACSGPAKDAEQATGTVHKVEYRLTEIATSERQWTGLTVGSGGRLFATFPRWSADVPVSLGELVDGKVVPYPNENLNGWTDGGDPAKL